MFSYKSTEILALHSHFLQGSIFNNVFYIDVDIADDKQKKFDKLECKR